MEFDWIPKWWSVITTLVALLVSFVLLWLSKTFARREDLEKLEKNVAMDANRIASIEERLSAMPTREEVNALRLEMATMRGDIKALSEALKPVNHVAQLLLEQRLNEK